VNGVVLLESRQRLLAIGGDDTLKIDLFDEITKFKPYVGLIINNQNF
jgi:hypothetical protein